MLALRPRDSNQLHRFVQYLLDLDVTRAVTTPGHSPPLAYLAHAFFEGNRANDTANDHTNAKANAGAADCIVWANRGGGKTCLGAVATLLDLIFKPSIQIRVLGGSMQQSSRMHEHLLRFFERPMLRALLKTLPTQTRLALANGSVVEMLHQSHTAVRGQRVHKLRCDEVEQFKRPIWDAAQFVTRSGWCGDRYVHGSIEAFSTMHEPFGLMSDLLNQAAQNGQPRVFKWNAIDVIEQCETARPCDGCELWNDCRGVAKNAAGFVPVDDIVAQWRRSGNEIWQTEMMCARPRTKHLVYPGFDECRHVIDNVSTIVQSDSQPIIIGGMDFGVRSPMVVLWAEMHETDGRRIYFVFDEFTGRGQTFDHHLDAIDARPWPRPAWFGVDPAGRQRNGHSGNSDIGLVEQRGYAVKSRASRITEGIRLIHRALDRGELFIHPRCVELIRAFKQYHYDAARQHDTNPVKDGPDHWCDALRYMLINAERRTGRTIHRSYIRQA